MKALNLKKNLACILAVLTVLMAVPFIAPPTEIKAAANSTTMIYYGLEYSIDRTTGDATIIGYVGDLTVIDVPEHVNGCPVVGIADSVFNECDNLTEVDLSGCTYLKSIGKKAFYRCGELADLNLSGCVSLESIGEKAFYGCEKLADLDLSECASLESIGIGAFLGCSNMASVDLSGCVALASIGNEAFEACLGLKIIDLSCCTALEQIGSRAFYNCIALKRIKFPDGVKQIGSYILKGTAYYQSSASWENGVMYINKALISAKNTVVGMCTIKEGTTTIASYAFNDCYLLTGISIPESVMIIGEYAFYKCNSLNSVYITDIISWCEISFEQLYSNPLYYKGTLCLNGEPVTDLVISGEITRISNYAFYGCSSLISVDASQCTSLKSIGNYAFRECKSLVEVNLSECTSLESIGNYAFRECKSLVEVNLSECTSLEIISEYAFYFCSNLKNISIPVSVTSIKDCAFSGCTSLECEDLSQCTSLEYIGEGAFSACYKMKSMHLPDGLQSMQAYSFEKCINLTMIIIPKSVKYIAANSFDGCEKLSDIWYEGTYIDWHNINKTVYEDYETYYPELDSAHKHYETKLIPVKLDCTKETILTYECEDGHHFEILEPAIGEHTPGAEATCVTDQICIVCRMILVEAYGHTLSDPATCTKNQICTVCERVLEKAFGHTPNEKEATCIKNQICTVCDEILTPALGHDFKYEYCNHCGKYEYCGDINGDGKVNSADSNILKRIVAGLITVGFGSYEFKAADIDCDYRINSVDSNILKRMIAGAL